MSWTKNQYYVSDGFFVANKKVGHGGAKNTTVPLKYIRKVSSKQTGFQKKFGYGTFDIRFTENNFEEKIVFPRFYLKNSGLQIKCFKIDRFSFGTE
jgi:hypothetical protein